MAFCPNCGASVEGRFCAKCGANVGGAAGASAPAGSAPDASQQQWGSAGAAPPPPGAQPYGSQQYGPPGATPHSAQAGGLGQNVAGALAYVLGVITGIIFLVLAPHNQNRFVRFHALQSIFLHLVWIAFWIMYGIIAAMLPWSLMFLSGIIWTIVAFGGLVLWIICIIKAFNNQMFKIPVIGDFAEKQA